PDLLSCCLFLLFSSILSFLLFFFSMIRPPPISPLFPYTTLFRSRRTRSGGSQGVADTSARGPLWPVPDRRHQVRGRRPCRPEPRRPRSRAGAASSRPPRPADRESRASAGRAPSPSSQHDLGRGQVIVEG